MTNVSPTTVPPATPRGRKRAATESLDLAKLTPGAQQRMRSLFEEESKRTEAPTREWVEGLLSPVQNMQKVLEDLLGKVAKLEKTMKKKVEKLEARVADLEKHVKRDSSDSEYVVSCSKNFSLNVTRMEYLVSVTAGVTIIELRWAVRAC